MDDKELLSKLKSEGEKLSSNSFAAIKNKIEKTDRYIAMQVKKETEPMIPNSVPEVEAKQKGGLHFNWKVFTPVALSCCILVALPIVISQTNQPVAKCDAYVGITYEEDENILDLRMEVKDDKVDISTLSSVGELGNMLISGIIKENKYPENPLLSDFISRTKEIATQYSLIDNDVNENVEFIVKDEQTNKKFASIYNEGNIFLMGDKSDFNNMDYLIKIYDISNRLFGDNKHNPALYTYIRETLKNSAKHAQISAILQHLNEFLPLDHMADLFKENVKNEFLNHIPDALFDINNNSNDFMSNFIANNEIGNLQSSFWNESQIPLSQNKDEYWLNYWYNRLNLKRGEK